MIEVYKIDNISKQIITIYVQERDDSPIFTSDGTQISIQPRSSITVEEDRVNLGQLIHLARLNQIVYMKSYATNGSGSGSGSGSEGS